MVKNRSCRFYVVNFTSWGGRVSFENLFCRWAEKKVSGFFIWVLRLDRVSTNERSRTRQAGQDADFLASYCRIDDIFGKSSVQLKVLILYRNGKVIVRKSFDNAAKSLITNWRTGKRPVGNTANISFPSRSDLTGTSCSGLNLNSLRRTTLKSAKALDSTSTPVASLVVFALLHKPVLLSD